MKNDKQEIFYAPKAIITHLGLVAVITIASTFLLNDIVIFWPYVVGAGIINLWVILREIYWLAIDKEKFVVRALLHKEVVYWKDIKEVHNDYPRIRLTPFTSAELEAALEKSEAEGTKLVTKKWPVYNFDLKAHNKPKRLIELVSEYATAARFDEGIELLIR